ncbi:MAG: acyl-CoA dehydrogenase family protein [Actinomycetota bacterium]|nr:acyl-CoA dehydrogenase family protein [Actinomycetota bacterium]
MNGGLRTLLEPQHEEFRGAVREFVQREVVPHQERWDAQRLIDRGTWLEAGKQGLLGISAPTELGGGGVDDFRYRVVLMEELAEVGAAALQSSFSLQDDVVLPYLLDLGTKEQQERWVPGACSGELIGAIAMTEPGAGSDLQGIATTAVRDGDHYVLNGSKTFISSGIQSDFVIVVARTDPSAGSKGISLLVVEEGSTGFSRGRKLSKVGLHAQDTAELFFSDCRVPAANLLGRPGGGFGHLMERLPLERLAVAVASVSAAQAALRWTVTYVRERRAFGGPLAEQQTVQFALAELATEVDVTQSFVDAAVRAWGSRSLTSVDAAKAKWWATDVHKRVVDRCVQLHGGYGYMTEYPIARAFLDARVQSIYGGANEVMKLIIGRDLATPS